MYRVCLFAPGTFESTNLSNFVIFPLPMFNDHSRRTNCTLH